MSAWSSTAWSVDKQISNFADEYLHENEGAQEELFELKNWVKKLVTMSL